MAQQTAVEWLIEQISEKQPNGFYVIDTLEDVKRVFEQAKQMEKEQNINLLIWMNEISKSEPMRLETDFDDIVEQYYNEISKSEPMRLETDFGDIVEQYHNEIFGKS